MTTFARPRRLARAMAALAAVALLAWWGLAPLSFRSWHRPVEETPGDHGIAAEDITFQPADQPIPLRAWWMPAPAAKAAIIMVHGGGGNRAQPFTDWLELAGALVARRYSVLALDLRNHGDSGDSVTGLPSFGPDEANDVIAAMDEIGRRTPETRFAGLGHSMGGQTVLYAARRDARLEAVVSDCTFTDVRAITPRFAGALSGLPRLLFRGPFLWSAEWLHGLPLGEARALDVIAAIAPRPVLIIHDQGDPIVPAAHARALAAAGPSATLWITALPESEPVPEAARSPFGTHAKSYMFNRDAYVARVVGLFDGVFSGPPI